MAIKVTKEAPPEIDYSDRIEMAELTGKILALEPIETDEKMTTPFGEKSVMRALVSEWNGTELVDLGNVSIWSKPVQKQLADAVGSGDVILGKLARGRRYELLPIDAPTTAKITKWIEANA